MGIVVLLLALGIGIICLFWLITFFYQHDFSLPTRSVAVYKRVVVIFPHPDDEALSCGGLMLNLARQGSPVTLAILTYGEAGEKSYPTDRPLADIRREEAQQAAHLFQVSTFIHENFGDGKMRSKTAAVKTFVAHLLKVVRPDLVITFDLAGLYGHEDHMVTSEVVTELVQKRYPRTKLWYVSLSPRVLKMIKLPEHMAKDPSFKQKRVSPTHKVFVGLRGAIAKVRALYVHRSQFNSFSSSLPFRTIPPWFFISQTVYEYFYEVKH